MKKLSECRWVVSAYCNDIPNGDDNAVYGWEAETRSLNGLSCSLYGQADSIKKYVEEDWKEFAKLNGIKNWVFKK